MKLIAFCFLVLLFFAICCCKSEISVGYRLTLAVPIELIEGFLGEAYLMETDQMPVNFKTALSVEAVDGRYTCSLGVFLGGVKVWTSGHRSKFYTTETCVLELAEDGDLHLKGADERVGWRTGTSGQGVEKLQLLESGNLALIDTMAKIRWQTFNFPTDVLLWGQRLSVATHLTSFPSNATYFFSFEIQHDKSASTSTRAKRKLTSRGLVLFDDKFQNFAQILSQGLEPVRFLALENDTGNLGLYHYSPYDDNFEASFQALDAPCDLPIACSPYGICTLSSGCSCIRISAKDENTSSGACGSVREGLCGEDQAEMLELEVGSVLRSASSKINISKEECGSLCLDDCNCAAALYASGVGGRNIQECSFYDLVRGVRQVKRGSGLSYLVKVPKGEGGIHRKSGLRKWVLILIVAADLLVLSLVLGGIGYYYMIWNKKDEII
ncbi:hypothetical protein Nepgr_028218 [Nepenthes gracilis]|uniref:Bulb-type lectin domain-containing protein n=1 Tax=Nepenthes gracilis TaxID=150966 RepID=A0AAD3T9W7_NEPGR|nr:hypothetical protein Nepgr_028218 [Nepenthes gracilis]